ncbi:hypothetical protein RHMOL_Rhmol01G0199400 [Rhododendron molle]|uniref:Uncharacterized protein n=1 Tax=Rhododendron molle TaxID=49168 RepID=A0ACC0Q5E4_RHOML|nr:hypothetical protein RHMOL_Rhmol01G0199400 [Rhododendron molle]
MSDPIWDSRLGRGRHSVRFLLPVSLLRSLVLFFPTPWAARFPSPSASPAGLLLGSPALV